MVNFLSLLGWSPGTDQEVFTREELVKAFALEGISGGDAIFNRDKLDWFNQQHIVRLPPDELAVRLRPVFEAAGLWNDEYLSTRHAWFFAVLELLRRRVRTLGDFATLGRFFFVDTVEYDAAAVKKYLRADGIDDHLLALDAAFVKLQSFDPASTEGALRAVAEARGVEAAWLIHAVRVAVTGKTAGPGLFELLALVGRDRVHARLAVTVRLISSRAV
jgi:glutamyl/glutaminyl-tRNA synthetase